MIISKMIYDPTWANGRPNKMGSTVGLVLHTPKFWNCHEYDFYISQFDEMRNGELTEEEMEYRYQSKLAHRDCKRKHMSYRGYAYWVAPKHRYTFRYMGALSRDQKWWKPFSISSNRGSYIRWFDNGPKPPPKPAVSLNEEIKFRQWLSTSNQSFNRALDKARSTMLEYEKKRDRR